MMSVSSDDVLRTRETARRKALWTLVQLQPGDKRALDVLDVLNEVEQQERSDASFFAQAHGAEDVLSLVPTEHHSSGYRIVRDASIPQPWRERFLQASVGSTRVAEGAYEHDWQKFLKAWLSEMRHLESHRAVVGKI
ncbi:MAG: hypothetical protein ACOH2T_28475 [Pseudomonas sp.]